MSVPSKLELEHFVSTFPYSSEAFLVDEVLCIDLAQREIEARMDTTRSLPVARYQVGDPGIHPRHVSGPDLVLLTGNLAAFTPTSCTAVVGRRDGSGSATASIVLISEVW